MRISREELDRVSDCEVVLTLEWEGYSVNLYQLTVQGRNLDYYQITLETDDDDCIPLNYSRERSTWSGATDEFRRYVALLMYKTLPQTRPLMNGTRPPEQVTIVRKD